ncbi:MAG: D-alanine--D-alanine ligase [Chloroflexota bacterium]
MKIAVLFGGISTERNVSINGGRAVCEALRSLGHEVVPVDPAFGVDLERSANELISMEAYPSLEELAQFSPRNIINCINSDVFDDVDLAFLVLHGKWGEDGTIQALLELRGIPYTGSDVKSSSVSIDKVASKILFSAAGIQTPPWAVVRAPDAENIDLLKDIRTDLGPKLVVKPNDQGSTIGLTIIKNGNLDDLADAVRLAAKYSREVVIEEFIEGRELTVGIVGDTMLPVIEIIAEGGFYDYEHKYTKGRTEYVCPAEIEEDIAEFTQNLAHAAHRVLGCAGFSRVDFRLDSEGVPYCLEINTIPGFTATSLVPKAAAQIGIEFPELCEKIVELSLDGVAKESE